MTVKLLNKQHVEFLSLKKAAQARLSLHLSKCHIVVNQMSRLICFFIFQVFRSCSCIPGGVATSGLCESDCPLFWPWNVLNFISALIGSTIMMPTFIFFIR